MNVIDLTVDDRIIGEFKIDPGTYIPMKIKHKDGNGNILEKILQLCSMDECSLIKNGNSHNKKVLDVVNGIHASLFNPNRR